MIYRIIDKETKLFLRDDNVWNKETELAITTKCPQGFTQPKWIEPIKEDEEIIDEGYWIEGANL